MAQIARKTKRYPSDLTDEEWDCLSLLMPKPGRRGRPREVDFREVINAVRYLVRLGCGWRMLPIHFGAWQTVYGWFRELARRFLFQTIHDIELMLDRERCGREASPSAAVIDSQSVKAPSAEERGFDANKKIVGRKRHIAVDTDGRLLMVNLTTADISDSAGAQTILDGIRKRWPWIKHLFADGAYDRLKLMDKASYLDFVIEIIRCSDKQEGFKVLPRRWVVERTFGWMIRWRRLVRNYEKRIDVSQAMILVATVDRFVRHRDAPPGADKPFQRFPTWMWRNTDVQPLTGWMRAHNAGRPMETRAGFYGLDMYNMSGSIGAVIEYLDRVDPESATVARERYGCLTPWQNDPATYGRAALSRGNAECERVVIDQCRDLLGKQLDYAAGDGDAFLDAAQNARLIASAERYYRIMYYGGAESWNLRDTHMFETLQHLLDAKGPNARAIIWAHNSHISDARAMDMGQQRGELNIGQLCRERWGNEAALIGLGTHTGTVAAATDWDGDMEVKRVNPSRHDSYERLCHDSGVERFLLDLAPGRHEALRRGLMEPRLERFIGVIYRPDTERWSHYSQAVLPQQFDAYVWFDETAAVSALGAEHHHGMPETYPFGE